MTDYFFNKADARLIAGRMQEIEDAIKRTGGYEKAVRSLGFSEIARLTAAPDYLGVRRHPDGSYLVTFIDPIAEQNDILCADLDDYLSVLERLLPIVNQMALADLMGSGKVDDALNAITALHKAFPFRKLTDNPFG